MKYEITLYKIGYRYCNLNLLFQIFRLGMLKWHEVIPPEEIWVKIGGDKGGATFKEMFQIVNIDSPNAPRITVVFCAFPANDSIYNLKLALVSMKQQVNDLQGSSWR